MQENAIDDVPAMAAAILEKKQRLKRRNNQIANKCMAMGCERDLDTFASVDACHAAAESMEAVLLEASRKNKNYGGKAALTYLEALFEHLAGAILDVQTELGIKK